MVRRFSFINEKGQTFSCMDINNYCFLSKPKGLGYDRNVSYEKIGNTYIESLNEIQQGKIDGQIYFNSYSNYSKFINFIVKSQDLKFEYVVPYEDRVKTFYRDITIISVPKGDMDYKTNTINDMISIDCRSLWYEKVANQYQISSDSSEVRWDFTWDARWSGYTSRELNYINPGHVDASLDIVIYGETINPTITLYIEGELFQTVTINETIEEYEKLAYSSREGNFYIKKIKTDGTEENLLTLDNINFENDNVVRIPPNKDCTIKLSANEDIAKATITIYVYYIAV